LAPIDSPVVGDAVPPMVCRLIGCRLVLSMTLSLTITLSPFSRM
jgi:hypothetical protein